MRKLLNRKIRQQAGICVICHEEFTDYNDVVPYADVGIPGRITRIQREAEISFRGKTGGGNDGVYRLDNWLDSLPVACRPGDEGRGYGVLVDIILGILGGIVGGWIFGMLGIWPGGGVHYRGLCGCSHSGMDHTLNQESIEDSVVLQAVSDFL
jgi:hypothetical protein